jgi:hypothetical protein
VRSNLFPIGHIVARGRSATKIAGRAALPARQLGNWVKVDDALPSVPIMRLLLIVAIVLFLVAAVFFFQGGSYLIVNHPEKSDAIVMLNGDQVDKRYWRGLELLRAGYGQHLIMDVGVGQIYGHSVKELAQDFITRTAGANASQVSLCPIDGDSTKDEAPQVGTCLQQLQPPVHSAILVSDDYHTRRALSIFRDRQPQYQWTAAGARNEFLFGLPWWKDREWAKTYLTEVEKTLYWQLWDRWRK